MLLFIWKSLLLVLDRKIVKYLVDGVNYVHRLNACTIDYTGIDV